MSSADLALMGTTAQMVLLELQVFQALMDPSDRAVLLDPLERRDPRVKLELEDQSGRWGKERTVLTGFQEPTDFQVNWARLDFLVTLGREGQWVCPVRSEPGVPQEFMEGKNCAPMPALLASMDIQVSLE